MHTLPQLFKTILLHFCTFSCRHTVRFIGVVTFQRHWEDVYTTKRSEIQGSGTSMHKRMRRIKVTPNNAYWNLCVIVTTGCRKRLKHKLTLIMVFPYPSNEVSLATEKTRELHTNKKIMIHKWPFRLEDLSRDHNPVRNLDTNE